MRAVEIIPITILILVTIFRLVLNNLIYRNKYNYHGHSDGVATKFDEESIAERDNMVVLFVLSLFTFFWLDLSLDRKKRIWSNLLSVIFVLTVAFYLLVL